MALKPSDGKKWICFEVLTEILLCLLIKQLMLNIAESSFHPLPPPVSRREGDYPLTPPSTPAGTPHPGTGLFGDRGDINHGTKEHK